MNDERSIGEKQVELKYTIIQCLGSTSVVGRQGGGGDVIIPFMILGIEQVHHENKTHVPFRA